VVDAEKAKAPKRFGGPWRLHHSENELGGTVKSTKLSSPQATGFKLSRCLPLPARAEQTQHAKPSGEKRESGWKRYSRRYCSGNQHLSRVRVSSQFLHQLLSWCDKGLAKIPANVCIQCDQTIPQK
jgi:hypothetical protein